VIIFYILWLLGNKSIFKSKWFDVNDKTWDNSQVESLFDLVLDMRTSLNHVIGANNPKDMWVELQCNAETFDTIQVIIEINRLPNDEDLNSGWRKKFCIF